MSARSAITMSLTSVTSEGSGAGANNDTGSMASAQSKAGTLAEDSTRMVPSASRSIRYSTPWPFSWEGTSPFSEDHAVALHPLTAARFGSPRKSGVTERGKNGVGPGRMSGRRLCFTSSNAGLAARLRISLPAVLTSSGIEKSLMLRATASASRKSLVACTHGSDSNGPVGAAPCHSTVGYGGAGRFSTLQPASPPAVTAVSTTIAVAESRRRCRRREFVLRMSSPKVPKVPGHLPP